VNIENLILLAASPLTSTLGTGAATSLVIEGILLSSIASAINERISKELAIRENIGITSAILAAAFLSAAFLKFNGYQATGFWDQLILEVSWLVAFFLVLGAVGTIRPEFKEFFVDKWNTVFDDILGI
jgi:hypothetical protein